MDNIDIDAFNLLGQPSVAECIPRDVPTRNPEMEDGQSHVSEDWYHSSKPGPPYKENHRNQIRSESSPDLWTTKSGQTLKVSSMSDRHLANAMAVQVRIEGLQSARAKAMLSELMRRALGV